MGFLGSLFGRRRPSSPEGVREALFEAVARGDDTLLAELAAEHEAIVLQHFGAWQRVPEAVRLDPASVQAYAHGLIGVAQHFAEMRGRPELLTRLAGPAEDNPIVRWQRALSEADARMQDGDYRAATEIVRAALEKAKGLTGSGVDALLPVTLGRLGTCLFQTGDAEGAVPPFDRALSLCEKQGEDEGVRAYLSNLYEVHRYRGDAGAAATCLSSRADLLERLGERELAEKDRQQVAIVRAGEPKCRIAAMVGEQPLELSDVPHDADHVRFVFVRNRVTLRPCTVAVEEGVVRGEAGDFDGALACFHRAANADRFDPWPLYHAAMTLLHLRRYREAVESFRRVEELAPGWYHCRADQWLAEQLAEGAIDHTLFERLRRLVDGSPSPEQALAEARKGFEKKELALLHLIMGDAFVHLDGRTEAEKAYRRGLAIAEEPDVRTRLLVALGACQTVAASEREDLLRQAVELSGNLVAAATATVMLSRSALPDA
jgi:tetratricopeptide (TPR) repeat protein